MPADPELAFGAIKALVIQRTLHHYYADKDGQLRDRVQRRMAATGTDAFGYLALLQGTGEPAAEAEWTALETEITIGETFFFRYVEQFAALSEVILPTLLRARAATRRLRIWSAGCASGAEPYSVAILLHRLLGDSLADWSVSILGTDLDAAALEAARRAEFGHWTLRSLSEADRRRDFVPVDDSDGRRWRLRPAFRDMVRFERQNLLALVEPGAPPPPADYDLVLCRNVLIYFHPERVQALVRRFGESLAADGWLLLGHAEAGSFTPDGLRAVTLDRTVAWMRADVAAVAAAPTPPSRLPPPAAAPARPAADATHRRADRVRPIPAPAPNLAPDPATPLEPERAAVEEVRRLADAGATEAALDRARQMLLLHPVSAPLFFYAALLGRGLGRDGDAEADFRRAIYLCKSFAMAHYHLGLLLTETGRPEAGRRAIAEAAKVAAAAPADEVLSCGDGITAARLRLLTRLDWLGVAAATAP